MHSFCFTIVALVEMPGVRLSNKQSLFEDKYGEDYPITIIICCIYLLLRDSQCNSPCGRFKKNVIINLFGLLSIVTVAGNTFSFVKQ